MPRKLMKKKIKLNGKNIDVRRIAFQPVPSQPVPREFDLIRNRRARYLKSHGFSDSQIADGVLGDRPLVAIVGRGIHETQASYEKRWKKLSLLRASKREKKFIELALYSLAAAIEGKRLWIRGEYASSFKLVFGMAATEALLWRTEIETKKHAEGAEGTQKKKSSEWNSIMEIARDFVAAPKKTNPQRPSVKEIFNHVTAVVRQKPGVGGSMWQKVRTVKDDKNLYGAFARQWARDKKRFSSASD